MTPGVGMLPVGIGLRQPHVDALLREPAPLRFVEVHSENFFATGGAARAMLRDMRAHYDVSLHGVSLGLGSATGLDADHLRTLSALVAEIQPWLVSDHACFCRARSEHHPQVVHGADLLPVAFTDDSLALMVSHVQQAQEALRRPLLVENISAYVRFADDAWAEVSFLTELCRRSGCQLLLDVNNLVVNALNWMPPPPPGTSALDTAVQMACHWMDQLPPEVVGQVHLAGHRLPASPGDLVIDDHSRAVNPTVWMAYRHALARFGVQPTLIEWDVDLPALDELLAQARQACACMAEVPASPVASPAP